MEELEAVCRAFVEAAKGLEACPGCGTRDDRLHGMDCPLKRARQVLALIEENRRLHKALTEIRDYRDEFGGPPPDDAMRRTAKEALDPNHEAPALE